MSYGKTHIDLQSEDRFAVISMEAKDELFAPSANFANFCSAIANKNDWMPTFDLRGVEVPIYDDVRTAMIEALGCVRSAIVLCDPAKRELVDEVLAPRNFLEENRGEFRVIEMRAADLPRYRVPTSLFSDYAELDPTMLTWLAGDFIRGQVKAQAAVADGLGYSVPELTLPQIADLERDLDEVGDLLTYFDDWNEYNMELLSAFVNRILTWVNRQSLLSHLIISDDGTHLHVSGHHSHSLHHLDPLGELVQPSRIDRRWNRSHARTIAEFEDLINTKGVHERELEAFLVRNPLFLRGLNYTDVYTQLVLPGTSPGLRPDLFVASVGSAFADIIELKRADTDLVVHSETSKEGLGSAVRDAINQLHSYREYFFDSRNVERFEARYASLGLRCYRPRLVAIVGRAPSTADEAVLRRMITRQPDIEVLPWDLLLQIAKTRILL